MKKKNIKRVMLICLCNLTAIIFSLLDYAQSFASDASSMIVVSLGDSYSSGEGIEPFYGQDRAWEEKIEDKNWLAHRSTKSWGSLLTIPGVEGVMGEYFTENYKYDTTINTSLNNTVECKWYFKAASGAETKHMSKEKHKKPWVRTRMEIASDGSTYTVTETVEEKDVQELDEQLKVFEEINANNETVDYVTLTIGGNDIDFDEIITLAAEGFLGTEKLNKKIETLWSNMDVVKQNIKQVYLDINTATQNQATIIVAGYPKLLSNSYLLIDKSEAYIINNNVSEFNDAIESLVLECSNDGMNIHFVDVEKEFYGHEAYSPDAWINPIYIYAWAQDLDQTSASQYSIHPNEKGAQAYARCVNRKIAELEQGTIFGRVVAASDEKVIAGAKIKIYSLQYEYDGDGTFQSTVFSDETGYYNTTLSEGDYRLEISADNYITFSAYVTVTASQTMDMETLFMVENGNVAKGNISGVISDYSTGSTIRRGSIIVRKGYNNTKHGEAVIFRAISSYGSGKYQLELEPGNYTLYIQSYSYAPKHVNVAVSPGGVIAENVALKSIGSDGYRIVLTWGANPRNLNSHIVENNAQHSELHVYYMTPGTIRSHLDNCELDVDDKDGYGPETITLVTYNTAEAKNTHYYYYVHLYEGVGTLASSNAQVKIYKDGELIATRNVPTNLGADRYWNVFAIVGGEIVFKDTITSTPDTSYAKSIAEGESRTILAMSEDEVLVTDSEAMIATDSDAILATGSEAIIDVDDEPSHDKYDAVKEDIGDEDDMKETMLTIQENSSDTTNISRRTRLY